MWSDKAKEIRDNFFKILVLIIVLTPTIWLITDKFYTERINVMKEQINALKESRDYFEMQLKQHESQTERLLNSNEKSQSPEIQDIDTFKDTVKITEPEIVSKIDVLRLAQSYGLTKPTKTNPHLRFKQGDISYWYEQGLSLDELKLEFESRRIVLEQADRQGRIINTQGDLSHEAESIQANILKIK